jgi:endonuclease/exonuclease/phosphatase (EEP) superfamily protein YafD
LVTGAALAGRRWPLAITAGLVAVVHVAAVVPTLATSGPPPRGPGTPVRVVTANSSFRNVTPDTWAAELLALDADVLFVQEYAPSTRDALVRAGVRREYPFQAVSLLPFSAGLATFSRLPMRGTSVRRFDQDDFAGSVKVGDDLWLRVLNVHTVALPNQVGWRASFSHLERYVADEPTPLVAAGDFNATLWNQPMRALLDGPLRDAHDDRGRGLAATWPVGRPGPPFALLDHVLVTSSIDVRRISERTLAGSDHRAVVADLVVRAA